MLQPRVREISISLNQNSEVKKNDQSQARIKRTSFQLQWDLHLQINIGPELLLGTGAGNSENHKGMDGYL